MQIHSTWLFSRIAGIALAIVAALVFFQGCSLDTRGEGAYPCTDCLSDSGGFGGNLSDVLPGSGGSSGSTGYDGAGPDSEVPIDSGQDGALADADGSTSEDADATIDAPDDIPDSGIPEVADAIVEEEASPDSAPDSSPDVIPETSTEDVISEAGDEVSIEASNCPSTQTDCNGFCVNTDSNANHCGACEHQCLAGQFCIAGKCN